VEFIPEPTDSRIVSAADASTIGHQDEWRSEVVGWAPDPIVVLPRRVRNKQRIIVNTGVMLIVLLIMWALWNSQFILEIPPQKSEWAYEDTGIRQLQDSGLTGDGIRVCMVDTGIDISHPDLADIEVEFKDFVGASLVPVDYGNLAHGTLMAGILVADGYMKGVAPGVTFGMAAALGDNGEGSNSGDERLVADAIDWCRLVFDADIISLSLGGEIDPNATREGPSGSAVFQALSNGVYVVAAAGNDGGLDDDGRVASPSHIDEVIAVGAIDETGSIWSGSSIGSSVDSKGNIRTVPNQKPEISAPGVDILSTGPEGEYYTSTGTSDSTVFVSGILALILEAEPGLRQPSMDCIEDMKIALMNSVIAQSGNGHDTKVGYGAINGQDWLDEIRSEETCS
jgi:serine protease AprX